MIKENNVCNFPGCKSCKNLNNPKPILNEEIERLKGIISEMEDLNKESFDSFHAICRKYERLKADNLQLSSELKASPVDDSLDEAANKDASSHERPQALLSMGKQRGADVRAFKRGASYGEANGIKWAIECMNIHGFGGSALLIEKEAKRRGVKL